MRSLVIMRKPWTSRPLRIWGPIPLNSPMAPSCSMMYFMTSVKDLKGFPFLDGGGFDWRPTLATMRGWVAIVASVLESEPRTVIC